MNMWLLFLIFIVVQLSQGNANNPIRVHRNAVHNITDCLLVSSETGYFTYTSTSDNETVCGLYLLSKSQDIVEITFTEFDVPCNNRKKGNLVQYLDGWELNGETFPSSSSTSDKPASETEFCSDNKPMNKVFVSSQNGALISYRISDVGKGFTVHVAHRKNPSPCNMIQTEESFYILRSHGINRNCSIWAPYPILFKLNSYSVGDTRSLGSSQSCSDSLNKIEIGGGFGLNVNEVLHTICNESSSRESKEEMIFCSTSTITLVSNGSYNNYLNISTRPVKDDEISNLKATYQCSLPSK